MLLEGLPEGVEDLWGHPSGSHRVSPPGNQTPAEEAVGRMWVGSPEGGKLGDILTPLLDFLPHPCGSKSGGADARPEMSVAEEGLPLRAVLGIATSLVR